MITVLLKVVDIRKETADTITLCFKQPGLKKIKYLPGQYLTLIFRINGRRYIRPYSFSSAPGIDLFLEVTIKRVVGGVISNHVNDEVKINDFVEVMLPIMGDFTFDPQIYSSNEHVVLWGVGSGVTPLMSIAKYILGNKTDNKVTLVYGNRNHDTVIFAEDIKKLQLKHGTDFSVWHFHTKSVIDKQQSFLIQGRISPLKVLEVMQQDGVMIKNSVHYICGPNGLKDSVKKELYLIGISEKNIFTEDFELVKDPKEFVDIFTRQINIKFDGLFKQVEVVKGKSILEAGLDASLELPYSCQTGNCIVCKGKIISGSVKMIGLNERPEKLLDDECLLCCSYPTSDNLEIHV